jgi:hypothetical protein
MPATSGKTLALENPNRTGYILSLHLALLVAVSFTSSARAGIADAVGVIDAIGRVVNQAKTPSPAPPPPQTHIQYVPVYVHPPHRYVQSQRHVPRHCWYERREVYDGEDYVAKKVKVCP